MLPTPAASAAPDQEVDTPASTMLEKPQVRIHTARSISSSSAAGPMRNHYHPPDLFAIQAYRNSGIDYSPQRPPLVHSYPAYPSQSLPRLPQLQQTASSELPPLSYPPQTSFVPRTFALNAQLQQFHPPAALLRDPPAELHPFYEPHNRPPPPPSFTEQHPNWNPFAYRTVPPYQESRDLPPGSVYEHSFPQRTKHHIHQSNRIDQDGLSVLAAAAATYRPDEYTNPTEGPNVLPPARLFNSTKRARVHYSGAAVQTSRSPSPTLQPDSRSPLNISSSSNITLFSSALEATSINSLAHPPVINQARSSSSEPNRSALISPPPPRSTSSRRRTSSAKKSIPEEPPITTSSSDSMGVKRTGSEALDTSPEDELENPPTSSGRTADSAVRRQKNTEAARRSRFRKAQRLLHLETMVSTLETQNSDLAFKISLLEAEKARWEEERHPKLRRRIAELESEIERGHRGLLVVAAGLRPSPSPTTANNPTEECLNRGNGSLCECDDRGNMLRKQSRNTNQRESGRQEDVR
ncbi:hypothetical protein BJ742DRAFT_4133 [Cladochytrium replicatum]|nr:hypothetical protein BJ742DRAFT_4133 [Cladochytrium replicatum]